MTQDKRLIEIFDRYGLKCTFNLNSARPDEAKKQLYDGISDGWRRMEEFCRLISGHEDTI